MAASVVVGRFDVQGVVPGPEDAAVLVAPDRAARLVDLSDLDGVPILLIRNGLKTKSSSCPPDT
jgi:hypothetical protein